MRGYILACVLKYIYERISFVQFCGILVCLIMFEGLVSALGRENSEVGASYIYIASLASVGFYKLLIHISLTLRSLFAEAEYWEDVRTSNAQPN